MADRMTWFHEAKLGMFIHWGPYSVAGVEASWPIMVPAFVKLFGGKQIGEADYWALADRFNPKEFDAAAWVAKAKSAGMRYLVFTSKHHDGYCMFDAPGTEFKITTSEFGRDIVAELAEACHEAGLRFGLYYSPPDMHHPGYRDTSKPAKENWYGEPERPEWQEYLDYMERHIRHLLTAYGTVDLLWFDGLFEQHKYEPARFHRLIREISPDIVINDRLGPFGDYVTPEQGIPDGVPVVVKERPAEPTSKAFLSLIKTLSLPVVRSIVRRRMAASAENPKPLTKYEVAPFPAAAKFQPWETCMTMNRTWAYSPSDTNWKAPDLLIRLLAKVVSRGGNYLLNVGPDPLGRFPDSAEKRLQAIGAWMQANGDAVYSSSYGPPMGSDHVVATRRAGESFLFLLSRPKSGVIELGLDWEADAATLISTGSQLPISHAGGRLAIEVSEIPADALVPVIRVG